MLLCAAVQPSRLLPPRLAVRHGNTQGMLGPLDTHLGMLVFAAQEFAVQARRCMGLGALPPDTSLTVVYCSLRGYGGVSTCSSRTSCLWATCRQWRCWTESTYCDLR